MDNCLLVLSFEVVKIKQKSFYPKKVEYNVVLRGLCEMTLKPLQLWTFLSFKILN